MADFQYTETGAEPRRAKPRGFTLLELMIVIVIIMILAAVSVGRIEQSIIKAHEAALHQDLSVMRQAIQNYTLDKEAAPNSLEDLHTAGFIGEIPVDPITKQKDWTTSADCGGVLSPDQVAGGICDVHSASNQMSYCENRPYSEF